MKKPRVLIIENAVAITGGLKSVERSSAGLKDSFEFIFIIPRNSRAKNHLQSLNFEVYELPMAEIKRNIFSLILYFPILLLNTAKLFSIVKRLKVDLIVSNDLYNLLPALYKLFRGNKHYVVYVRFLPSKFPKLLVKFWCAWHHRYASGTVAVSKAVEKELPYRDRVTVIGNELPSEEIQFVPAKKTTTILYPANYIPGKGQEYALESWALISEKHPQWKLKFVGSDMGLSTNIQFKQSLIKRSQKLQMEHRVEWCGFSEKITDEYLDAEIVLNFSESESFSLTCLEAMFHGRPVIATRSGGPSEIIDHDDTGILVGLKDLTAMAEAMDYLISNADHREAMARRAYEAVRQRFSPINTTEKLRVLYRTALQ